MTSSHSRERLELASGVLAVVVAGVHLYWGIPRFTNYASIGSMPDPRPLAFVLSGHAIMIAITLVVAGVLDARRTYLPGMGLVLVHILGYVAWHTVFDHRIGHTPGTTSHSHAGTQIWSVPGTVLDHLLNSPLALLSKTTELALLVLLGVLYVRSRRG